MCTNSFVPCYLFVSLLFIFFGSILAMERDELRRSYCSSPNYTSNSSFSSNLALALSALRNDTPATGFSILTVSASSPEAPVTAMALCRGSLNQSLCQACVDAATSGVLQACPGRTGAIVWFTYCTIRYSPDNFTNEPDNSLILELYDVRDSPGNAAAFDLAVNDFVRDLSVVASVADKRYAVAKSEMPTNRTLYGYVDCTRDIDSDSCQTCLSDALQGLHSCCFGKWAGWVGTPSCSVQVNLDPVHDDWKLARDISYYYPISSQTPEPEPEPEQKPGGYRVKKIGVAVGGACALIITAIGVMMMCIVLRARKRQVDRETCEEETFLYGLDLLVAATDNFSSSNLLGRGGFGIVYKGKMADGEEVAVKVLTSDSEQGQEEFMNEIKLLLRTQHRNLVRLLGCCTKGDQKMLVYEYLPNNSLDSFLFDKSKSAILDWTKRYNIIMGIARALLHLHQDCEFRIVHRDIKASNVLLDEDMNPKVSDFGLAKLFTNDDPSKLRTRRIAGTFGYMAPEYAIRGLVSTKGDVFSFGVLLLEIISGRKNFDPQCDDMEMQQLLKHVWRLELDGRVEEIVDVTIGSYPPQEVMRCIRVGLLCTQKCIQDRPTMAFAMLMLSNTSTTIPVAVSDDTVGPHSVVTSVNSVTLTGPTGR